METNKRKPVMVVGLDGLDLRRLLPFVNAGELPAFGQLLQRGAYAKLKSVSNMTTGPTWASFATGCFPETHGILHDFHHDGWSYRLEPTKGRDLKTPTFWQVASAAQRHVVVLNAPMSFPVQPVNGTILAGIDAPHERAPGFEHPAGVFNRLRGAGIDYMIDCGLASYMQRGRIEDGWQAVEKETEGRTAAAEYLLQVEPWDLFVVVYSLPDVWQHYYWTSPSGSTGEQYIRNAHRLIDQHLQRLLALLPEGGSIIVCSDHGFGPLLGTRDAVNRWLEQQGLLNRVQEQRVALRRRLFQKTLGHLRKRISFRARQQILASLPQLRRFVETEIRVGGIDFANTQVYAALDHLELWVNVVGRQRDGCVDPSAYLSTCERVANGLRAWRSPSGEPYVRTVEISHLSNRTVGAALEPDLRLTWNDQVQLPDLHPLITGDHAPDGTFIAAGAGIACGELAPMSLIDVAPVVLAQLGIATPTWMEGAAPIGLR